MFSAVIINGSSDLPKEFHKISLFKVLWNICLFSIIGAIMIDLIALIVFGHHREIDYLKGFSVLVFSEGDICLADNISNDIYKIIFLLLNIGQVFNLLLLS